MSADPTALVASPHWRWMPGMLGTWSDGRHKYSPRVGGSHPGPWASKPSAAPVLSDPATRGCIAFDLIPAAWEGMTVDVRLYPHDYRARVRIYHPGGHIARDPEQLDAAVRVAMARMRR